MEATTKMTAETIINNLYGAADMTTFDEYLIDIQTRYFVHSEDDMDMKDGYAYFFQSLRNLFKEIKRLKEVGENSADGDS